MPAGMHIIRTGIERILKTHAEGARPVAEVIEAIGFRRLPRYFDAAFLDRIRCAAVERVPLPPFVFKGLRRFAGVLSVNYAGITYGDTYFVDRRYAASESLHFHELVHALQWQYLGFDKFVSAYVGGLLRNGYTRNPLEVMVCDHQRRFEKDPVPYPVGEAVRAELRSRYRRSGCPIERCSPSGTMRGQ